MSRDPIEEEDGPALYAFCHNDPVNQFDPLGDAAEWHHLLPQQFEEVFSLRGLDIHNQKYGLILDVVDHRTGQTSLHRLGWNSEWEAFMGKHERKPTRKQIIAKLRSMYRDPKYASVIKHGKKAKLAYRAWRTATTVERRSLYLASKAGLSRLGAKGVFKKAVPGVSLLFVVQDVRAKGVEGGIANTLFDATPYMGWVKLGTECVYGDWIPDGDGPEPPFQLHLSLFFPTGALLQGASGF